MRSLRFTVVVIVLLVGSWHVHAQCCARKLPVMGQPVPDTPTPAQSPTPTPTSGITCSFHLECDGSAASGISNGSNGQSYVWVNPQAARIIDSSSAGGTSLVANQVSQYLYVTDFAGSNVGSLIGCTSADVNGVNNIPDTATILGFEVQVRGCEVGSANPPNIRDEEMRIVVGGVLSTTNHASPNNWDPPCVNDSNGVRTYGAPNDLWGFGTVTGADIKASNFGVALSVKAILGTVAPTVDGFVFSQICYKLVGE